MPPRKQGKYRFIDFEVDLAHRSFRRAGQAIAISPRTFDLLVFFLQNPQRVVTKDELMKALWLGASVEESDLRQHIFLLRKALTGDQPGDKLLITVPGRGYEFTAPVTEEIPDLLPDPDSSQRFVLHYPKSSTRISAERVNERDDEADRPAHDDNPVKRAFSSILSPSPWQLAAGAAALVLLVVAGWLGWRWLHHSRPESLRIVVADFENSTGNLDFDLTLRTALIIDLRQSPFLQIATRDKLAPVLLELKGTGDSSDAARQASPFTGSLARQACRRLNDHAYITGEIHRFAQKYLVTLQAFGCERGSSLAASRGIADSPDGVLAVLDKVTLDLRAQLGETSASIARFNKPLFTGPVGSLEALRAYSDASYLALEGQLEDSLKVYRRAMELDPKFAMAYADMGMVYNNLGEKEPASVNLTKAYELRDAAGELNRLSIIASYNHIVTRDIQAAIRNDKQWAEEYPHDPVPLADLADLETQIGKPALALDPAKRALALNPDDGPSYVVLARAQMHTGQFEEAAHTCNQAISHHADDAQIHGFLMQIAFLRLDQQGIDEQLAWARARQNDKAAESYMQSQQGLMDFALGKAKAAEAIFATVIDAYRKQGMSEQANNIAGEIARTEAELGYVETAYSTLSRLPTEASSPDIPVAWAETGETSRAQAILQRETAAHPFDTLGIEYQSSQVKGAIALNQHQPEAAIAALTPALPYDLRLFGAPSLRGKAYLAANQPSEAEAEFHKILDHPGIEPFSYNYPLAQLGLARALARQDKIVEAGFAYKIVLQIWKDADSDLPRLREAKAEYARLNGESPKPVPKPAPKPHHK
jgi:eukaryotic-like serine/threonine-protein kinase